MACASLARPADLNGHLHILKKLADLIRLQANEFHGIRWLRQSTVHVKEQVANLHHLNVFNQFTFPVYRTHQGSQQTITEKTKRYMFKYHRKKLQ